jgi:predicted HicB family RNase H-like nuclease
MKRQTGFRLTERAHEWLKEQARERGISKNDVVQELINKELKILRIRRSEMDKPIRTQLRIPAPLYEAMREQAYARRQSRNQFMAEAIREKVEAEKEVGAGRAE